MGYSIDHISANCYPGSTILTNKFNIRDEEKLNEIKSIISSARYAEWLNGPQSAAFDFDHYKPFTSFSSLSCMDGQVKLVL